MFVDNFAFKFLGSVLKKVFLESTDPVREGLGLFNGASPDDAMPVFIVVPA